jgi:hypothetical protein
MPKYKVVLVQHKEKIIRASSLDVAFLRADKLATATWSVDTVRLAPEEPTE